MTDVEFGRLCNTYGFAPSRALRELLDCAVGQAQVQRKPLTEEEITQCFKDAGIAIEGQHWTNAVRNVERAHGIGS